MAAKDHLQSTELLNRLIIREASLDDLQIIHDLEMNSFGEHVLPEELNEILTKELGQIFLAFDQDKLISYQVVLFKQYGDKDSDVEKKLQPLLVEARNTDPTVMHDDVHFDGKSQVYFHLIGTVKEHQNKGVVAKLKQYALAHLSAEHREKQRLVCIRVNNLASIRVNMKVLGVCMTSLKPIDLDMIGSRETNFNATSDPGCPPILNATEVTTREIVAQPTIIVDSPELLIPVRPGSESDLNQTPSKVLIQRAFEQGYVVRGVFKAEELGLNGDSYFYCTKRPQVQQIP